MSYVFRIAGALALLLVLTHVAQADIEALNPSEAPRRSIIEVLGDAVGGEIVLDAGETNERVIAAAISNRFFSLPPDLSEGKHTLHLRRNGVLGTKHDVTVSAPQPFPGPRLDRISVVAANFHKDSNGTDIVSLWLYVQAANGDASAEILIDGTRVAAVAHQALRHSLQGIDPIDLAYPIYHHVAYLVPVINAQPGGRLRLQIRNLDGALSAERNYDLPADPGSLDSDGDDIPDEWERGAYQIDLRALGADPLRPNIFVKVDVMAQLTHRPTNDVWATVIAAFANAPILNPSGMNGIKIVIDASGSVPFYDAIDFEVVHDPAKGQGNFCEIKRQHFDRARLGRIFHYAIWAHARSNESSGVSDIKFGTGPKQGNDFIVSLDRFDGSYQTVRSQASTFMHELGHNLGQLHGGMNGFKYNPVYNSIMSYSWQLRTGHTARWRRAKPVYAPLYYGQHGAIEPGGNLPANVGLHIDYSDGMGRKLTESALEETKGLYNGLGIDWNRDGRIDGAAVTYDIDGDQRNGVLHDYPNWASLSYAGPRLKGSFCD